MTDKEKSGSAPSPKGLGHSASVLNAGFTPGPWEMVDFNTQRFTVYARSGRICQMDIVRASTRAAEGEANARLIAAAPDLYLALTAVLPGLIQSRKEFAESACIMRGGKPDLSTIVPDDKPILDQMDAEIAKVKSALAKVDPKVAVQEDLK